MINKIFFINDFLVNIFWSSPTILGLFLSGYKQKVFPLNNYTARFRRNSVLCPNKGDERTTETIMNVSIQQLLELLAVQLFIKRNILSICKSLFKQRIIT